MSSYDLVGTWFQKYKPGTNTIPAKETIDRPEKNPIIIRIYPDNDIRYISISLDDMHWECPFYRVNRERIADMVDRFLELEV